VRLINRIKDYFQSKAVILLYHRIMNDPCNPFSLVTDPQLFRLHMVHLKKFYNVIPLDELVHCVKRGKIPSKSVVITFDDGYVDNFLNAKPILEELRLKATVFISTSFINTDNQFWWDRIDRIFKMNGHLPSKIEVTVHDHKYVWELNAIEEKQKVLEEIFHILRPLPPQEISRIVSSIEKKVNISNLQDVSLRTLNDREIKRMSRSPSFSIGAHTCTHCQLSTQPMLNQLEEIMNSKQRLEDITGCPVRHFSYPFGTTNDYTIDTVRIVKECGFESSSSTTFGAVAGESDLFELPRVVVKNWSMYQFQKGLKNLFREIQKVA